MAIYTTINWFLLLIYWILITIVTLKILMKRRTVSYSMAWLLTIYIAPILGIVIYLLFDGLNPKKIHYKRYKILNNNLINWVKKFKNYKQIFSIEQSEVAQSLFKLCEHRQGSRGFAINQILLFNDNCNTMNALIKDIKTAKKSIEIVFYIWKTGGKVDQVTSALIDAAKRGVNCRILLDFAGSINFFLSPYPHIMQKAGIRIVKALNINLLQTFYHRIDLRQHKKMILIDNYISYVGSMNMVDIKFSRKNTKKRKWSDIMVRMEGPVTHIMSIIFSCDWETETGEYIPISPIPIVNLLPINKSIKHNIQVIASGPGFPEGIIHQALLTSLYAARKKLIITTPYLIPSDDLMQAICTAAQRGVQVQLIIPKDNDSILVNWASRSFFAELLNAGVFIYQFTEGLLHTKSILIDEQLSLVGTVNLDNRSLWINFEITLIIDGIDFNNNLAQIQREYISKSQLIDPKKWPHRPYWQRIIEKLFYLFSPLL